MENKAVSNTGPIIHLTEISSTNVFEIFSSIFIPQEVENELKSNKIEIPKKIKIKDLNKEWKDTVKVLTNQKDLDMGESCAIALALQEKINYFLTDDLEARVIAKEYNLEVHGTIGLILRAFKEKIFDKKTAIEKVNGLYENSSLFITKDLIEQIINTINSF